jgi:hypothetical protein
VDSGIGSAQAATGMLGFRASDSRMRVSSEGVCSASLTVSGDTPASLAASWMIW